MFENVINDLLQAGFSESKIAGRVGSSVPTINRIRRGKQIPLYPLGDALIRLRDEVLCQEGAPSES